MPSPSNTLSLSQLNPTGHLPLSSRRHLTTLNTHTSHSEKRGTDRNSDVIAPPCYCPARGRNLPDVCSQLYQSLPPLNGHPLTHHGFGRLQMGGDSTLCSPPTTDHRPPVRSPPPSGESASVPRSDSPSLSSAAFGPGLGLWHFTPVSQSTSVKRRSSVWRTFAAVHRSSQRRSSLHNRLPATLPINPTSPSSPVSW
jgi:hypothetical protein